MKVFFVLLMFAFALEMTAHGHYGMAAVGLMVAIGSSIGRYLVIFLAAFIAARFFCRRGS
jgi:hypothetical protein